MYKSFQEIQKQCESSGRPFWKVVLTEDCRESGITQTESIRKMRAIYTAMRESDENYDMNRISSSGLVGTDAQKLRRRREEGRSLCDNFTSGVMERAMRVAESNACMRRIVAAPTAGSCGVMPAVLLSMQEKYGYSDDMMIESLYVAAGIGGVIAERASLSGAEGGCQAEIGSASGMAAGAAVFLLGGTEQQMGDACAMALSALMGLVCDPVAGLVEVPCVKRNVLGAMNAITSAEMAMSGISSRIPVDEVIDAMRAVGHSLSMDLKETGRGGLAGTPTGQRIRRSLMRAQVLSVQEEP